MRVSLLDQLLFAFGQRARSVAVALVNFKKGFLAFYAAFDREWGVDVAACANINALGGGFVLKIDTAQGDGGIEGIAQKYGEREQLACFVELFHNGYGDAFAFRIVASHKRG